MSPAPVRSKLKPDTPVGEAMAMVLLPRVSEIIKREKLAHAFDVDGIHDMRVATKRLREAARLFRPAVGKARLRRRMEHVERLNDALGAARELDVLAIGLGEIGATSKSLARGLKPLIAKLAKQSDEAEARLLPAMDETLPCIGEDIGSLVSHCPPGHADVWEMSFASLGKQDVTTRLDAAFALEEAARAPEAVADFHRMRIAIKKVKYALEVFVPVLRKSARRAIGPIGDLQEYMGFVHDWDVLIEAVEAESGDAIDAPVAAKVINAAHARREENLRQTLAVLDDMRAEKLHTKLLKSLT